MPRRFRFVAILALLVASVATLTACGGGSSGSPDAQALLKDTFGPNHSVKSGDLTVALAFDGKGLKALSGPVSLKLTGPFETSGKGKLPKLDLALAITGAGANFSAGAVTTGDKGWLKLQGTAFAVDDATFQRFKSGYEKSAAASGSSGGPTFSSLGIDPLRWLKDPKVLGTEDAGGAASYHITAAVDVATFLQDVSALLGKAGALGGQSTAQLPSSLTDQQRKDIAASVKDASLDVWTGKDDRTLRRLRLNIAIAVPEAVRPRSGGLTSGTLSFDVTIADLNQPQTVTVPKNARPLSELQSLIAGGATGATTSPPATTTTPAAPATGGASSPYLDCVAKAGSNVSEIQKCASLAGQ